MNLIQRYIFQKVAGATLMTFIALGTMVWLSQALRQFDLVTANGQAIMTFVQISALLVPILVTVVFPVALMIAVIYTFSTLTSDSELVVINASGARQSVVLRPVFTIAIISTLIVAAMTLYLSPLALRSWTAIITNVRGNIITQFMSEGAFQKLAPGLTFHMHSRNTDGSMRGIFVADSREGDKISTYLAEKGAVIENPLGLFLIMNNGTIQQRSKIDNSISMIEFSSYAFDLSSFATAAETPTLRPMERPTGYLLRPDPEDPYFRQSPGRFRAELLDRLTAPLYCFVFALTPLLFLGQATSTRQSRTPSITAAVLLTVAIRAIPVFLDAETSLAAAILMWAVPIGCALIIAAMVLSGVQLRPPDGLVAVGEGLFARASGLVTRQPAAPAKQRSR